MKLSARVREKVSRRAHHRCEFCGIGEDDAGGLLTVDHFRPRAKGGGDNLDNLIYCCASCNQYKLDYWPSRDGEPELWNPRLEPASLHFHEMENGMLHPLTPEGGFTIRRLRLNRQPLVSHRQRQQSLKLRDALLVQHTSLLEALAHLLAQQALVIEEQHLLLDHQRALLKWFLDRSER